MSPSKEIAEIRKVLASTKWTKMPRRMMTTVLPLPELGGTSYNVSPIREPAKGQAAAGGAAKTAVLQEERKIQPVYVNWCSW